MGTPTCIGQGPIFEGTSDLEWKQPKRPFRLEWVTGVSLPSGHLAVVEMNEPIRCMHQHGRIPQTQVQQTKRVLKEHNQSNSIHGKPQTGQTNHMFKNVHISEKATRKTSTMNDIKIKTIVTDGVVMFRVEHAEWVWVLSMF